MFSSPKKGRWTLDEQKELYSQIWGVSPTKTKRLILLLNRFLREKPKVVKTMMFKLCTKFFTHKKVLCVRTRSQVQIRTHLQKLKQKIKFALRDCNIITSKQKTMKPKKKVDVKPNTVTNLSNFSNLNNTPKHFIHDEDMIKAVNSLLWLSKF